jgi:hypothetical protein
MGHYFSYDELKQFKAVEGLRLNRVIYHYWQNKAKASETFEFLDKLELEFTEGGKLILTTSEETEGAMALVMDFDAEKQHFLLLHEFGGKLGMRSADLTSNILWEAAAGKVLRSCQLVHESGSYRNDTLLLDFGDEQLEVRPHVEGLLVEPYEEV